MCENDKNMHKKLKNLKNGATNLHKRAQTWVWVVTDLQNFALRADAPDTHLNNPLCKHKGRNSSNRWEPISLGKEENIARAQCS